MSLIIGPSTGYLSAKISTALDLHNAILRATDASAAEMVWTQERVGPMLEGALDQDGLAYRALHLGSFKDFGTPLHASQEETLRTICRICKQHGLLGTSLHPDITPAHVYRLLRDYDIPVGIENMDRSRNVGRSVEEIDYLISSTGNPGVLDLQHCYEVAQDNDRSIEELALAFAEVMLKRGGITHLHVSGEVTKGDRQLVSHAQLTIATNRDAILGALRAVMRAANGRLPIILEGDPLPQYKYLSPGETLTSQEIEERSSDAQRSIAHEISLIREYLTD